MTANRTWIACFRMDSVGIACERRRLPHLWGEPCALAGSDSILAAVSPECFPFGIKAGQSVQSARAMCQGVIILPYDEGAYLRAAESIWDMIAVETSVIEPVCPEIVFAEFSGPAWDVCHRVKTLASLISSSAMIGVNVGIATSKLVARQAAMQDSRSSPLTAVKPGREAAAVAKLPIASLTRLDRKLVQRLEKLGVRTLGDALAQPEAALHRKRDMKEAWRLLRELAEGRDSDPVRSLWPKPRVEKVFKFDDEDAGTSELLIANALRRLAEQVACGIQQQAIGGQYFCRSLTLLIELENGHCLPESERLVCPTHDASHLNAAARRLLGRIRPALDKAISTITLSATDLDAGAQTQLTMSGLDLGLDGEAERQERQAVLDAALSRLWRRFGPHAVITAALLSQARRIHLWTHTLAKMRSEPIRVYTSRSGAPVRYLRQNKHRGGKQKRSRFLRRHRRSRQLAHDRLALGRADPARLLARRIASTGIHELHRLDAQWLLEAEAD